MGPKRLWLPRILALALLCAAAVALLRIEPTLGHQPPLAQPSVGLEWRQAKPQIVTNYGKLPLSFEANQGQTDEQVKFVSRGPGYTLFLTGTEAVLQLRNADFGLRNEQRAGLRQPAPTPHSAIRNPQLARPVTLRMRLVGANPNAEARGVEELPGKSNYFIGNDPSKWRTNVPNYAKVEYRDVYPGVNLVYYGNQQQLEHDFVVAPGADPNAIRFGVEGADKTEVDPSGDLVLHGVAGEVRLRKPVVYQKVAGVRREVSGSYVLRPSSQSAIRNPKSPIEGSTIRNPQSEIRNPQSNGPQSEIAFQVGSYDPSQPLVIDPVLVYSTYLGGSGYVYGSGIAVDASGNAYVTGYTSSANFPTASPLQAASGGGPYDAFVSKLNAAGSALVYSTYLGGLSDDRGYGIAVDAAGSAYVTGYTNSANFPTTGSLQPAYGGGSDVFVAKLNVAGSALVYSTYLGGSGWDEGRGIAVDASGSAYVTGYTSSANFPTAGPLQGSLGGGSWDAFAAKLDVAGSALVYSTYLGGSGDDYGYGIAVDSAGSAYVTGDTNSPNFPTASALQATYGGGMHDAFVAKLNVAGSALVYSTYLGGGSSDYGSAIAVDASGNAYVTGYTASTGFPTESPLQPTGGGNYDVFVAKLNAAGSALVYSTYLGGSLEDYAYGIAVDAFGNAHVTGTTNSTNFPTLAALQATHGGVCDAFVAKLNAAGSALVYSTYLGGSGGDYGYGIAVDSSGSAYVTGQTSSTNFPTASPLQASGGAFLAKIAVAGGECVYSISPTSQSFPSSGGSGSVTVTTQSGCVWGAASNATWLTITVGSSGAGNGTVSYSVATNTRSSSRTGTLTIGGQTFTVTQSGRSILRAGAVEAMPGTTARIPITVTIDSGVSVDCLSFGLSVFANGSAPALSSNLAFQQDPAVAVPTVDTSGGVGSITVSWQGLAPALSGTVKLGEVLAAIPATATGGQSYTVQVTAASASLAGTAVPLLKGPNALVTVTSVNPAPTLTSLSPSNGAQGGAAFTLTVNGSNFITGSVVRWNGADRPTTFVSSTRLTAAIPTSDLSATGVAMVTVINPAPGGAASNGLPFTISVPNPAPAISSLSPTSATAGGAAFNLTVNGTSFLSNSVVRWNAADRPTAYSSATQLVAPISVGDIMAAGRAQVTVFNPAPGGGESSGLPFTISVPNPAPTISSLSPASATAGGAAFNLTVNGTGFFTGSVVRWNGADRPTAYSSATQLIAPISAGDIMAGGTAQVTVFNPAPGGGTSNAFNFPVNLSATPAAIVKVSGDNQSGAAGMALGNPLVVQVNSAAGSGIAGVVVSFAVTGGAASLSSATATTGSNGKAQVNVTLGTAPGTVTISASVSGVSPAQTFTATATVGPAVAPAIVSGNSQTAAVGTALANPLVVKIADQYGNPLSDVGVSFSVTAGSGTLSASSALTNSSGQAQVTLTLGTTAGTVTVNATISGVPTPATFTATATPGSPASLAIVSGNSQTAIGGSLLLNPLVTKLTDQYSNPVVGITVLFTVASGAGSLSSSSVITDSNGRAQVTWRLGAVGAEHAVHASAGTLPAVTFTATAITGPPATLTIVSGNNQTAVAGTTLPLPLVVRVTDQNGNVVPGVTVNFAATGGGGTVSAASAITASNGQAQVSWALGSAEGANTVQASAGALTPVVFTATGVAATVAVGTVGIASVSGSPGGSARIPVTLSMSGPATVDSVAFGLRVEAVGTAPALTDALSLAKDAAMAEPTFSDTSAGPGTISVGWLNLTTALSGTVRLGEVVVPIPALATDGHSYTVRITGASGSLGMTNMALLAGASVTLLVVERSYLAGDAFPLGSDLNSDTDKDDAGEFGDDQLQILDLIYALRAVTSVPGYRPPACSDRFDAIDSHPADTPTVRGGNATLNTVDLIYTLRRVTSVDTSRPRRYSRNLPCTAGAGQEVVAQAALPVQPGEPAGRLHLGPPEPVEDGTVRMPVYLEAARALELAGLSFSIGMTGLQPGTWNLERGTAPPPTLIDSDVPGVLAVAWLEGLQVAAGQRLLLGYVVAPGPAPGTDGLRFIGISANAPDGSEVRVSPPAPREQM